MTKDEIRVRMPCWDLGCGGRKSSSSVLSMIDDWPPKAPAKAFPNGVRGSWAIWLSLVCVCLAGTFQDQRDRSGFESEMWILWFSPYESESACFRTPNASLSLFKIPSRKRFDWSIDDPNKFQNSKDVKVRETQLPATKDDNLPLGVVFSI